MDGWVNLELADARGGLALRLAGGSLALAGSSLTLAGVRPTTDLADAGRDP